MADHFSVEAAHDEDVAQILDIILPSFKTFPIEQAMGNVDTPGGREANGGRHMRAWREHQQKHDNPCAIKCVHTDLTTGEKTIVGFAEWFIYADLKSPDDHERANTLISANWVSEEGGLREKVQRCFQPTIDARRKWLHGRRCAVLVYMCVHPAWRRRGIATLCVRWGVDRCRERDIMAYLEASEEGHHVYSKCGFEEVEKVKFDWNGEAGFFPAMICWPAGTREEDKNPAVSSS